MFKGVALLSVTKKTFHTKDGVPWTDTDTPIVLKN